MVKVIGITGLIASGKSTASSYLHESGYKVFDADLEVKKLYKDQLFLDSLKVLFSDVFTNNILDKKLLSQKVFSNKIEKKKLEDIIHPIIKDKCKNFIENNNKEKIIFLDIPLLFEDNYDKLCDNILLIDINQEIQKQRFILRGGDSKIFYKILSSQGNVEYKKSKSNYIIENNGTKEEFLEKIINMLKIFN